jgi:hypothetical protein
LAKDFGKDAGSVRQNMKFSRTHDNEQSAQRQFDALQKQGTPAWITNTPDGRSHVFWMTGPNIDAGSERYPLFPLVSTSLIEHSSVS